MTGILNKFYVEHGIHGARVLARSLELTDDCTSDAEVDSHIQMLKDDLDACAKEMKGLIKVNNFKNNRNKKAYMYLLTPQGMTEKARATARFLERKVAEYEALQREIAALRQDTQERE